MNLILLSQPSKAILWSKVKGSGSVALLCLSIISYLRSSTTCFSSSNSPSRFSFHVPTDKKGLDKSPPFPIPLAFHLLHSLGWKLNGDVTWESPTLTKPVNRASRTQSGLFCDTAKFRLFLANASSNHKQNLNHYPKMV